MRILQIGLHPGIKCAVLLKYTSNFYIKFLSNKTPVNSQSENLTYVYCL